MLGPAVDIGGTPVAACPAPRGWQESPAVTLWVGLIAVRTANLDNDWHRSREDVMEQYETGKLGTIPPLSRRHVTAGMLEDYSRRFKT